MTGFDPDRQQTEVESHLAALAQVLKIGEPMPVSALLGVRARLHHLLADVDHTLLGHMVRAMTAKPPGAEDRLLPVPEVAKVLGLGEAYTYDLVRRGRIPSVQVGKYVRVRRSVVDAFMSTGGRMDGGLYQGYNGPDGRTRTPAPQNARRADASRPRRAPRRSPEHGSAVGTGPAGDHRADGAPDRPDATDQV